MDKFLKLRAPVTSFVRFLPLLTALKICKRRSEFPDLACVRINLCEKDSAKDYTLMRLLSFLNTFMNIIRVLCHTLRN